MNAEQPDELDEWFQRRLGQIQAMLDPDHPMGAQQKFDAITKMAKEFLSLAQKFVGMAETANNAANSMIEGSQTGA